MVKKIEAVFPSFKLDSVAAALKRQGLVDVIVATIAVDEPQKPDEPRWSNELVAAFTPRLKLEVAVADDVARAMAHTIFHAARARDMARTSVIILPVEQSVEITTGERMK